MRPLTWVMFSMGVTEEALSIGLARIIHEGFYYDRRYVAATNLTAVGLAA